jgi:APA family basic amino acid/polyamine antiporter
VTASLLPIDVLGNLVSLGTAVAFAIVCISVLWLRARRPDLERPFRAPGGTVVPILGIIGAAFMGGPILLDMVISTIHGDSIPAMILIGYIIIGALIYTFYGLSNSRLAQGLSQRDSDQDAGPGPMQAEVSGVGKDHA